MAFRKKIELTNVEKGKGEGSLLHWGCNYKEDPPLWPSTEVPKRKINRNRATVWPMDPASGLKPNE